MKPRISIVLTALLVSLAPASAGAQNREHQQMTADIRMLQEQQQQFALTLAALNQALAEALKAISTRLDAANEATRKGFADQKLLVDNLANDVRVIRERSDDTNVRISSLREELEAMRATVQALQQMAVAPSVPAPPVDPNAPPSAASPTAPPPSATPPPALPSTAGLSPTRVFEAARSDYFASNYASAITGFEAFLRAFPRSELSDDAYFLIGESNFLQSRFGEALAAYNQVIQNYSSTNSVPGAYYKRGMAQERQGQVDAARASWETLVKNFPDTAEASLAKQALDRIGRAQR
jgi:tol-pal system protein YbgF